MKIEEIEKRIGEIEAELGNEECDIEALSTEFEKLKEERTNLVKNQETRKAMLDSIATGKVVVEEVEKPIERKQENKMDITNYKDSVEFRSAWLKSLQGTPLNEVEKRANEINLTAAAGAIPTLTQNLIIEKIKEIVPLLDRIQLFHVNGNLTVAVEGAFAAAAKHTENGLIAPSADTVSSVTLGGFEITKLLQISGAVKNMSISAFEAWIVKNLAKSLSRKIEEYIISGDGDGDPKGIDALAFVDETNAVQWAANSKPTVAELMELIGYLGGGYQRNAAFLLSRRTFWQHVYPLRDDGKAPIVKEVAGGYSMFGFPVLFSEYVDLGDIFLGDFEYVVANLAEDVRVESARNLQYNSYDYLGVAVFDCKPALSEAFVKGAIAL